MYGSGHIHETFLLSSSENPGGSRYILQHINRDVFDAPDKLMQNVGRVIRHIQRKIDEGAAAGQRCLSLVPTTEGQDYYVDAEGEYWRVYDFIDRAETFDNVRSTGHAFEAAAAFAQFQGMLTDLPTPPLHEVIPGFHDTPTRFRQLAEALDSDAHNRAMACRPEIDFAAKLETSADALLALHESGEVPQRVVHNDTKINNVMFDSETGKAVCVIDVDTVMPGLSFFDFGDLVRTATASGSEDEKDASKMSCRIEIFEAIADGYLSIAGGFLTETEIDNLHLAGQVITAETGVRFLTDFLRGDVYFHCDRLYQNLDRCRAQFALVRSIEDQLAQMQDIVRSAAERYSNA